MKYAAVMEKLLRQLEQRCVPSSIDIPVALFSQGNSDNGIILYQNLIECQKYNPNYVKLFIQRCILDTPIEKYLIDWIYDLYLPLLKDTDSQTMVQEQKVDKITYRISNSDKDKVIILEKPNLIAETSTTGFRTWEASIYLCKYLQMHKSYLSTLAGNWLELGAGTGMTSIYLSKLFSSDESTHLFITDGDAKIVNHTIKSNIIENKVNQRQINLLKLSWGKQEHDGVIPSNINYIIGADIVYDHTLFRILCETLKAILSQDTCKFALICSTIRNVDTDLKFQQICAEFNFNIQCINDSSIDPTIKDIVENEILYKPLLAPTKIYKITI